MAAPRIYTDEQRAAIFALYEDGVRPAEIARRCKAGLASVAPFQIPRRTVQEIVTAIARERGASPPRDFADIESGDAIERYPALVVRILNDDAARIIAKDGPPTEKELERLHRGVKIVHDLHRNARETPTRSKPSVRQDDPKGNGKEGVDTLQRLARTAEAEGSQANGSGANGTSSRTRTPEPELEGAAR